jgi:hypothetical protein
MLVYEHERTQSIVSRLVKEADTIHTAVIITCTLGGAAVTSIAGVWLNPIGGLVGLIVGAVIGYVIGKSFARVAIAAIEWMIQILIAQEQILDTLQSRYRPDAAKPDTSG